MKGVATDSGFLSVGFSLDAGTSGGWRRDRVLMSVLRGPAGASEPAF